MPEMDGLEATKKIRKMEDKQKGEGSNETIAKYPIPIIAVTANAMKGDRERFLAAGMNDYIAKPIKSADLSEVIARCMKNNGLKSEDR